MYKMNTILPSFFSYRTGWRFRLPRSLFSQNRIRFTLQTPTLHQQILIMRSVRSAFCLFFNLIKLKYDIISVFFFLIEA